MTDACRIADDLQLALKLLVVGDGRRPYFDSWRLDSRDYYSEGGKLDDIFYSHILGRNSETCVA